MEVVVEVVILPKAGGAVVGAEVCGAVDEAPNPPNVGTTVGVGVGCEDVVVGIDPKEGVVEVLVDPNDGTVLELDVPVMVPNVGAVAADDDVVPKAKEVEPAPNDGTAVAAVLVEKATVAAGVDAGAAALVANLGAAPPNENAPLVAVVFVAVTAAGAADFAPKLNPVDAVVVVAVAPNAGGGAAVLVAAAAADETGGLNALKPPAVVPPKLIVGACVTEVVEVAVG